MGNIATNIQIIRDKVNEAAQKCGRDSTEITLMAVSKYQPVSSIQEAITAGQLIFGENKVQEGVDKVAQFDESVEWHMIGHLQRNKARKVVTSFDCIHGVDSLKLASHINNIAIDLNKVVSIYLQINIAKEPQKSGFLVEQLEADFTQITELSNLKIMGLMCIPPATETAENSRKWFSETRKLKEKLEADFSIKLPGLSMGMSSDFDIAIEEGATIVRVGSTIFGARITT